MVEDIQKLLMCESNVVFVMNVSLDPTPESERNKIAVGTAGLLLGLVFFGAGMIYYKKNTSGEGQNKINAKKSIKSNTLDLQC